MGAFVLSEGAVRWQSAVDVNRLMLAVRHGPVPAQHDRPARPSDLPKHRRTAA